MAAGTVATVTVNGIIYDVVQYAPKANLVGVRASAVLRRQRGRQLYMGYHFENGAWRVAASHGISA